MSTRQWTPIMCLDFDGVLHSYDRGWQGARNIPDKVVPGAMAFLVEASKVFDIAILSARTAHWGGRRAMKRWIWAELDKHLFAFSRVVLDDVKRSIYFPRTKHAATIGLDDRVITFTGTFPSIEALQEFQPWNRRG